MEHMYCHSTIQGLNNWTTGMFTKFGWMILAHDAGKTELIRGYIHSLQYLLECIRTKQKKIKDRDTIHELKTLEGSVKILLTYTKKNLSIDSKKKKD